MENKEIKFEDNFLSPEEFRMVANHCYGAEYIWGESDDFGLPPTGMISQIRPNHEPFALFKTKLKEKCPFLKDMSFYRMYVNCFAPNENPYLFLQRENGAQIKVAELVLTKRIKNFSSQSLFRVNLTMDRTKPKAGNEQTKENMVEANHYIERYLNWSWLQAIKRGYS